VVPQAKPATERAKPVTAIGAGVVGREAPDRHAAGRKPAVGQGQEGRGAGRRFVGEEGGIGQARPIIDGDVEELRAAATAAPAMIAVNPVAHPTKAAQLLDIQVDQLPREARSYRRTGGAAGRGRRASPRRRCTCTTAGWQPFADECRELADELAAAGGPARHIALVNIGITGNSHMLRMEDNSLEIADFIVRWLEEQRCCPRKPRGATS
jgi:hypothetical protein